MDDNKFPIGTSTGAVKSTPCEMEKIHFLG